MISNVTINKVFESARVEEVISEFVALKKTGANYKSLSPFVDEKTPSFVVSPAKQIWKDFSSGKGGNVVSFLMEHELYTYPEAIKYLAKKYGIEVEETAQSPEEELKVNERESMFLVNKYAKEYYKNYLLNTEYGKSIGLMYLKERGFKRDVIERFELGIANENREEFSRIAIKKGFSLAYLEKTGLTMVTEKGNLDRFWGRLLFPILSLSGRVLGFGGRILKTSKTAKYINSPESEVYNKSKTLFGLFQAKQAIVKNNFVILVEGYTDVLQFFQIGVENVVASSGTALTKEQINLIKRYTKNITLIFDSDSAGNKASLRGVDLILEQGLDVNLCSLPVGEDPDSFAKKHTKEGVIEFIEKNTVDFIDFKVASLSKDLEDPNTKASAVNNIISSIVLIPNNIKKEIYVKRCAKKMNLSERVLFEALHQKSNRLVKPKKNFQERETMHIVSEEVSISEKEFQNRLEGSIIIVLLKYGGVEMRFKEHVLKEGDNVSINNFQNVERRVFDKIFLELQEDEIEFSNSVFKEVYQKLVSHFSKNKDLKLYEKWVLELPQDYQEKLNDMLMEEERYKLDKWENAKIFVKQKEDTLEQYIYEIIADFRFIMINKILNQLMKKMTSNEVNEQQLIEINQYNKLKEAISQNFLSRVVTYQ